MQNLEHAHFEAVQALADIGTKLAAGRAALSELESSKGDFLDGRAEEATQRVAEVLVQSKGLLDEIGKYHSELVEYRNQVDGFVAEILYFIQSVERWKEAFDKENTAKLREINNKIEENTLILSQIQKARSLLEGESSSIKGKRAALNSQQAKINDEWATLGRTKEELDAKK